MNLFIDFLYACDCEFEFNEINLCVLMVSFSYLCKFNEYDGFNESCGMLYSVIHSTIFYSFSSFFEHNCEFDYHAFANVLSFLDHGRKSCNVEVLLIFCSLTVLVYHL